ncbi:hypothetical protein Poly51_62890 [Rubripirellula tenax]|uniref:Uncharacterized protein n=1 Tax=Rubripirellula tenax TaxID=2528015 RepID=A0A5C6E551_9BACT|nr:hypothetical protein Poly51_62890 [Rubripirellula tenax]
MAWLSAHAPLHRRTSNVRESIVEPPMPKQYVRAHQGLVHGMGYDARLLSDRLR